jgi:hypothetical protein
MSGTRFEAPNMTVVTRTVSRGGIVYGTGYSPSRAGFGALPGEYAGTARVQWREGGR